MLDPDAQSSPMQILELFDFVRRFQEGIATDVPKEIFDVDLHYPVSRNGETPEEHYARVFDPGTGRSHSQTPFSAAFTSFYPASFFVLYDKSPELRTGTFLEFIERIPETLLGEVGIELFSEDDQVVLTPSALLDFSDKAKNVRLEKDAEQYFQDRIEGNMSNPSPANRPGSAREQGPSTNPEIDPGIDPRQF